VFRDPGPDGYTDVRRSAPGDALTPRWLPDIRLAVSDILD
jgi:hypothetical protein